MDEFKDNPVISLQDFTEKVLSSGEFQNFIRMALADAYRHITLKTPLGTEKISVETILHTRSHVDHLRPFHIRILIDEAKPDAPTSE